MISRPPHIRRDVFWIIDTIVDGERVVEFFTQEAADRARSQARTRNEKEESDEDRPQGSDRSTGRIP
jgi:hypothetical protein